MESSCSRKSLVTALPVGRLFFPQREKLGFDARQLTPLLVLRVVVAAAQTRAFTKAAIGSAGGWYPSRVLNATDLAVSGVIDGRCRSGTATTTVAGFRGIPSSAATTGRVERRDSTWAS